MRLDQRRKHAVSECSKRLELSLDNSPSLLSDTEQSKLTRLTMIEQLKKIDDDQAKAEVSLSIVS